MNRFVRVQVVSVLMLSQLEASGHSQWCLGSGLTHFHTFSTRQSGTSSLCCLKQSLSPLSRVYALNIPCSGIPGHTAGQFLGSVKCSLETAQSWVLLFSALLGEDSHPIDSCSEQDTLKPCQQQQPRFLNPSCLCEHQLRALQSCWLGVISHRQRI